MAVGAVSAISGSSRQIIRKASGPVSVGVRPEPGWHRNIIAVSNLSAHVVQFTSAHYTLAQNVTAPHSRSVAITASREGLTPTVHTLTILLNSSLCRLSKERISLSLDCHLPAPEPHDQPAFSVRCWSKLTTREYVFPSSVGRANRRLSETTT